MTRGGENRDIYVVLVGKLGRNGRLGDPGLDGGIISVLFSFKYNQQGATFIQYSLLLSVLYVFQAVFPLIIRSSNSTHSIWYMSSVLAATASVGVLA